MNIDRATREKSREIFFYMRDRPRNPAKICVCALNLSIYIITHMQGENTIFRDGAARKRDADSERISASSTTPYVVNTDDLKNKNLLT